MKDRVLDMLVSFTSQGVLENPSSMFKELCDELHCDGQELQKRAVDMLESIAHNYAAFDISTIDKFNQRLIRTFAFDLKLPVNFEVELDTEAILSKAVDQLIHRAGDEPALTSLMLNFALEKLEDDRSWDIAFDLNQIAKLLINENHFEHVASLEEKTSEDFEILRTHLAKKIIQIKKNLISHAIGALTLIDESGLEHNDFLGANGYLPSYFVKITKGETQVAFDKAWMEKLHTHPLYPKSVSDELKSVMDDIQPNLTELFEATKSDVLQLKLSQSIYRNLTPLSLLKAIFSEVSKIKEEENLLLISEFNSIVSHHLKEQPAPFIYERIGERYKHFFIDEFQDTSVMQWQNLIPLIGNALSTEGASATLVGDAKQAIYRWRGGKAEQFIALHEKLRNPFSIEPEINLLEYNYRSSKAIINFNNDLFGFAADQVFTNSVHKQLYLNSGQKEIQQNEGYVNLTFLDPSPAENEDEMYPEKVHQTIINCLQSGFQPKDITILVRYKKDGVSVAEYLTEHSDLNIISSETLLLSRSDEVQFIMNVMTYLAETQNQEAKFKLLKFLITREKPRQDFHDTIESLVTLNPRALFKKLEVLGFYFHFSKVIELPIYELAEIIIHSFELTPTSNGYVQYLLDFIWEYSLSKDASLTGLIEHYETKKDTLSLTASEGTDAINIMTIHKAKGLEFPVVIFPYADLNIYSDRNSKVWLPLNDEEYPGFSEGLINYNKDLALFGEAGEELYANRRSELELDNMNLLYVALTRAVDRLYILSSFNPRRSKPSAIQNYADLFLKFLQSNSIWEENKLSYSWGIASDFQTPEEDIEVSTMQRTFISTPKKDLNLSILSNAGYMWDTEQQSAIEKGNLIHLILSRIKTFNDIDFVFDSFLAEGKINMSHFTELKPLIQKVVSHTKLSSFFEQDANVYIEREILLKGSASIRPDRLVINENNDVAILDYKTGAMSPKHEEQLLHYEEIINTLDLNVTQKILIYINDTIEIKEM